MGQIVNIIGLVIIYGALNYASEFKMKMFSKKWFVTTILTTIGYVIITSNSL